MQFAAMMMEEAKQMLPPYMVPARLMKLDEFPVTR